MRAISLLLILVTFLMTGCASVEVAKGMTKLKESIETSVNNILKSQDIGEKEQKTLAEKNEVTKKEIIKEEITKEEVTNEELEILVEKKEISKEQERVTNLVTKQKKIASLNLLDKTIKELSESIGQPILIRKDGKTTMARFDSNNCRLFVFTGSTNKPPQIKYYELRNDKGELIEIQKDIESCFKEINTT